MSPLNNIIYCLTRLVEVRCLAINTSAACRTELSQAQHLHHIGRPTKSMMGVCQTAQFYVAAASLQVALWRMRSPSSLQFSPPVAFRRVPLIDSFACDYHDNDCAARELLSCRGQRRRLRPRGTRRSCPVLTSPPLPNWEFPGAPAPRSH